MTYSNTKKDKAQANWLGRLKNWLLIIILSFVAVSSLSNVISQYKTLTEAQRINREDELEIASIKEKISDYRQWVEYATSGAYKARRERQFYGLGLPTDFWIKYPEYEDTTNIGQNYNITENKPNIVKWWERFTK